MRTLALMSIVLPLSLVACKQSKTYEVTDTEGRKFTAVCKKFKSGPDCGDLKELQGSPAHPTGSVKYPAHPGWMFNGPAGPGLHYLAVCESWVGEDTKGPGDSTGFTSSKQDCRAVTCKDNGECPFFGGSAGPPLYVCVNGLCANPSVALDSEGVKALCRAGTGPWTDSPAQQKAEHLVIGGPAGLCGPEGKGPCTVPPFCHQP